MTNLRRIHMQLPVRVETNQPQRASFCKEFGNSFDEHRELGIRGLLASGVFVPYSIPGSGSRFFLQLRGCLGLRSRGDKTVYLRPTLPR